MAASNASQSPMVGLGRRALLVSIVAVLTIAACVLFGWAIRGFLLGTAGLLIAVFLYRISSAVSRRTRLAYWASLSLVGVALLAGISATAWLVQDRVAVQAGELKQDLPRAWAQTKPWLQQSQAGRWFIDDAGAALQAMANYFLQSWMSLASSLGTLLGEIFVVVFIGIFGAANPQIYVRGLMRLVPMAHRRRAREVLQATGELLWWWLLGQLVAMAFLGILTGLGVWLMGIPLALTLGLLAAVLNFIPNFGPILAVIPAMLLALVQGPMLVVWVIVLYAGLQLLQNHLVTPLVQRRMVQLPPVILMLAQVFMYYWCGLLGMALAPPIAAVLLRMVQMLYVSDRLGDPLKEERGFWPAGSESQIETGG